MALKEWTVNTVNNTNTILEGRTADFLRIRHFKNGASWLRDSARQSKLMYVRVKREEKKRREKSGVKSFVMLRMEGWTLPFANSFNQSSRCAFSCLVISNIPNQHDWWLSETFYAGTKISLIVCVHCWRTKMQIILLCSTYPCRIRYM